MTKLKRTIMIMLSCIAGLSAVNAQDKPFKTTAKISSAKVYFNSAEITQKASIDIPAGTSNLVIENIADYIFEESVQIFAPSSLMVLSVRHTNAKVEPESTGNTELDKNIKQVKEDIKSKTLNIKTIQNAIELLDNARPHNPSADTPSPIINVSELTKLVDFYISKRQELDKQIETLNNDLKILKIKLKELEEKGFIGLEGNEKKSRGKLIVQLSASKAIKTELKLNYLARHAYWKPSYDVRVDDISKPIELTQKAMVAQNTGLDWNNIKLTLSTGTPNQNNKAPEFSVWRLRYNNYNIKAKAEFASASSLKRSVNEQSKDMRQGLVATEEDLMVLSAPLASTSENQLSVSYDVDALYTILSNDKEHGVILTQTEIPVIYKYYSAPKLSSSAFLLAEIKDYSKYNLMRGEASIIFENTYVGKTLIDPNQTKEELSLSLGVDDRVNIKRELIQDMSSKKFLSSYKEQIFTYDISIRNNRKEAIEMQLKDQYPLSTEKDITVDLLEISGASNDTEKGELSWTVKLEPNETKVIRMSYKVKYPKNQDINL